MSGEIGGKIHGAINYQLVTAPNLILPTVNSNVGSFTNTNLTVNAQGLITAASNGSGGAGSFLRTFAFMGS